MKYFVSVSFVLISALGFAEVKENLAGAAVAIKLNEIAAKEESIHKKKLESAEQTIEHPTLIQSTDHKLDVAVDHQNGLNKDDEQNNGKSTKKKKKKHDWSFFKPDPQTQEIRKSCFNANRFYVGASGGFGDVKSSREPFIIRSGIIDQVQDQATFLGLLSVNQENGGLSGRLYTGYYLRVVENFCIAPEFGYSHYKKSVVSSYEDIPFEPYVEILYQDSEINEAYGMDFLINLTYTYKRLAFSLKGGCQYAIQKGPYTSLLEVRQSNEDLISLPIRNAEFKQNRVVPEIIAQFKWQLIPNFPLCLGVSFQYVFGQQTDNARDGVLDLVNQRKMLTLDLELLGF